MEHTVSIDSSAWAMRNGRLGALKVRNDPTLDNQLLFGDGDMNKIMDLKLYEATEEGDADKFIHALEEVSKSRRLALSLIFNQVTPSGDSLLHVAASSRKKDVMELILIHYPYLVTQKNSLDDTPLHVAVQEKSLEATRMLIHLRRDLEIIYWKNKDSKSPLYLAAETGDLKILQLLLEAAARDEAYAVKIQGMSPVLAALEEGKQGVLEKIIHSLPKLLLVKAEDGRTPLHSAAAVGNVEAVRLLLKECTYLALQTDKNGSYPLHIACEGGNVDIISQLVKTWPNLAQIKNKKRQNILHVAARGGNNDVVQCILNEAQEINIKKLVNSKDVDGNTPIHLALMHNHCQVFFSLMTMANGSDLRLLNNDKLTALDMAIENGGMITKVLERALGAVYNLQRSRRRDFQLPGEQSSGASQPSRVEWIKKEIDTRLVVATLVASVTFTTGITLPGGYNVSTDPHPGTATMLHNRVFQVFIIFNALATYSSIFSVVLLLWAHHADLRKAEEYYDFAGPLLSWAVNYMTVAFSAALILAVGSLTWLKIFVLCLAVYYLLLLSPFLLKSYASTKYYIQSLVTTLGLLSWVARQLTIAGMR